MKTIEYNENGTVNRKFTEAWSRSGLINMDKVSTLVRALETERQSMVEYIEALHNTIDKIHGSGEER